MHSGSRRLENTLAEIVADTPVLSVVIPFHSTPAADRYGMLAELLSSIPSSPQVEVIIVDDHSNPKLSEESYGTHRVLSVDGARRYAGAARNVGLESARGNYVIFADSDDVFSQEALQCVVRQLAATPAEDFVVYLAKAREFSQDLDSNKGPVLYENILRTPSDDPVGRRLIGWHAPWGKILPRAQLMKSDARFEENAKVANDAVFAAHLAVLATEVRVLDEDLYFVRRNHGAGALTARVDPQSVSARINAYRKMNAVVQRKERTDLMIPMHHAFRRHFTDAPLIVFREIVRSAISGETILPRRARKGSTRW